MERKDIKIGMRVRPSSIAAGLRNHTTGIVTRAGKNYLTVKWDDGSTTVNLKPWHLEPSHISRIKRGLNRKAG